MYVYVCVPGVYEGEAEALSPGGTWRQGSCQDHQDPALGQSKDVQVSLPSSEKKCYHYSGALVEIVLVLVVLYL